MTMRPQLTRTAIVYLVVATSVLSATADKHASAQTMCVGKKTVRPLEYELVCCVRPRRERGREGGRGAGDCESIARHSWMHVGIPLPATIFAPIENSTMHKLDCHKRSAMTLWHSLHLIHNTQCMPPPHVTVAAPTSLKRAPTSPPHTRRYVWPIPMQLETTAPPVGTGQPSVLSPSIKLVAIKGGADKVTTSAMARYRSILVNQSRGGGGDTAADADGGGGGVQVNRVEIVVSDSFLTGARHRFVLSKYVSLSLNKKMVAMPCLALCFSLQLPLHSFQLPPPLPRSLTHPLTHSCSLTHTLLQVDPTTDSAVLDLNTNYNYSLTLVAGVSSVQLKASSRFAVAHGLETLAQLYSPGNPPFGAFSVSDGPQFRCIFHQPSYSLHSTPLHSTPLHSTPLHSTPLQ
jgi:hypothetical protein